MAVGSGGGARRAWLRHGPAVPGFVPCGVGRGRDRRRVGGGLWSRPPPRLACPPHPVQVPSASRRGGLKTPWGVARPPRVGAVGPVGRSPFSPRLRRPPPPGAGVAAPRHGPCGRREGATRRPSCRACACAPCPRCVGVVGGNPLGACGVVRARPSRWGALAGCPVVQPFRPSRSLISFVSTGRPEAPSGECAVPDGGASPPGVGPLECSKLVRLLAVDHSARASMKNAASCEN